jgi:hypothetical protein
MWHYKSVIALFQIVLRLLTDLIALTAVVRNYSMQQSFSQSRTSMRAMA